MFADRFRIEFTDGTTTVVDSTQRDMAVAEVQAGQDGIHPPPGQLLISAYPVVAARLRAWAAYARTVQPMPWPAFDAIAVEVVATAMEDPDPTQLGTSDASSLPSPPEPE